MTNVTTKPDSSQPLSETAVCSILSAYRYPMHSRELHLKTTQPSQVNFFTQALQP